MRTNSVLQALNTMSYSEGHMRCRIVLTISVHHLPTRIGPGLFMLELLSFVTSLKYHGQLTAEHSVERKIPDRHPIMELGKKAHFCARPGLTGHPFFQHLPMTIRTDVCGGCFQVAFQRELPMVCPAGRRPWGRLKPSQKRSGPTWGLFVFVSPKHIW